MGGRKESDLVLEAVSVSVELVGLVATRRLGVAAGAVEEGAAAATAVLGAALVTNFIQR